MTDRDDTNAGQGRPRPDREAEWEALRATYLLAREERPPSAARGVHHLALVSSDVEQTIRLYQEVLEFPLTELSDLADRRGAPRFLAEIGFPLDRYGEAVEAVAQLAGVSTAEIEPVLTAALKPTSERGGQ